MSIKTAASFCKGNWQAPTKTKEVAKIYPIQIAFNSKKSERNTAVHLPKSAKKLDGEETRTILLNGHKVIPSNRMPNTRKVNIHTYFLEEVRIEGSGVTKASMLDHGVGLLALLKYPFYPLFILDNGMNLISKSLTILTPA